MGCSSRVVSFRGSSRDRLALTITIPHPDFTPDCYEWASRMTLRPPRPTTDRYLPPPPAATDGPRGGLGHRTWRRAALMCVSLLVILYSVAVLVQVASMGDIGVRCILGTDLKEAVPEDYPWEGGQPQVGDTLLSIGGSPIVNYTDYIRALRTTSRRVGERVTVTWRDHQLGTIR